MTTDIETVLDELDLAVFDLAAVQAADQIADRGYAHVQFSPGDATRYELVIVDTRRQVDQYLLASNYGPLYPIPDHMRVAPGYAESHYLDPRYRNFHTGVVYAQFIDLLGCALRYHTTAAEPAT